MISSIQCPQDWSHRRVSVRFGGVDRRSVHLPASEHQLHSSVALRGQKLAHDFIPALQIHGQSTMRAAALHRALAFPRTCHQLLLSNPFRRDSFFNNRREEEPKLEQSISTSRRPPISLVTVAPGRRRRETGVRPVGPRFEQGRLPTIGRRSHSPAQHCHLHFFLLLPLCFFFCLSVICFSFSVRLSVL